MTQDGDLNGLKKKKENYIFNDKKQKQNSFWQFCFGYISILASSKQFFSVVVLMENNAKNTSHDGFK